MPVDIEDFASPPRKPDVFTSPEQEATYYKEECAYLEYEMAQFQLSSKELEKELEKELDGQDKLVNEHKKKNEVLKYEVDEWKTKFKTAKDESNLVQTQLQKEITELREKYRTAQIRIREIEVSNDDFERQERIVKSSLDDLESKYNMAIERNAMNESEIQGLEQEREDLRMQVQRLKDEMAELRVEAELSHEKYLMAKNGATLNPRFQSPMPEAPTTPTSVSPTPKTRKGPSTPTSFSSPTPPSPPISETSTSSSRIPTPHNDQLMTPRPSHYKTLSKKTPSVIGMNGSHRRGTSTAVSGTATAGSGIPIPNSRSLTQIRGLIGQMQRLEQRVQSARSKMPPPNQRTPPRRNSPHLGNTGYMPINVTLRSQKKRPSSTASSVTSASVDDRFGSISRSFAGKMADAMNGQPSSRPSSRASTSSRLSFSTGAQSLSRPSSRASTSGGGSQIPVPDFTSPATKPRSSIGGSGEDIFATPRRNTLTRAESATIRAVSGVATPNGGSAIPRRKSMQVVGGGAGSMASSTRRTSNGVNNLSNIDDSETRMMPPPLVRRKKLNQVGET